MADFTWEAKNAGNINIVWTGLKTAGGEGYRHSLTPPPTLS